MKGTDDCIEMTGFCEQTGRVIDQGTTCCITAEKGSTDCIGSGFGEG